MQVDGVAGYRLSEKVKVFTTATRRCDASKTGEYSYEDELEDHFFYVV
jgi:hypothetical protein